MANETINPSNPADNPTRRTFGQRLLLGFTGALGLLATLALGIPFVGYLLGPWRKDPIRWVNLGAVGKYPLNQTRLETFDNPLAKDWAGATAQTGVFVRFLGKDGDAGDQFLIFAVNCAHLGCHVTWFPQSGLYMCPCHGGVYYENGERASGPPPRGLFQCEWRVREGTLEIQAPHYPTLQNTLKDRG